MEFKTISDTENALFNRREIEGDIHAEIVPSREEVRKILAEKFSVDEDTIKIRTIKGKFGSKVFVVVANIYKSKEDRDKIELKKKKDTEAEKRKVAEETKSAEPSVEEAKPAENTEKESSLPEEQQKTSDALVANKENAEEKKEVS